MKNRLTGIMALVMLLIVGLIAPATGQESVNGTNGEAECEGTWVPPVYENVLIEAGYTEIVVEAYWQRYSWTPKGDVLDQDEAPTVVPPHEQWQANVKGDPHGIGVEGPYDVSHGSSGKSDWFYLEYVDAVTIDHPDIYEEQLVEDGYCIPDPVFDVKVSPILECVAPGAEGGYIAYFGYLNQSTLEGEPTSVTIEYGDSNKFTPAPQDRGQPTLFEPGRTGYVDDGGVFKPGNAAVAVPFDGSNLVWTLDGRTSTASSISKACPLPDGLDTITITLAKEWFDIDGSPIPEPDDVGDWSIWLTGQPEGENIGQSYEFSDGERYGVQEAPAEGYAAVSCGGLTTTDAVAYNTSDVSGSLPGAVDGTFGATASGVHVVCNQSTVIPPNGTLEPVITLTVTKDWVGSEADLDGVTATLFIDEEETEWGTAVKVDAGSTVTLSEDVDGLDEDLCSWAGTLPETFVVPTGQMTDTDYPIEAVNVVACGLDSTTILPGETIVEEVIVEIEVPVEVEVLPEVIEREPEAAPVVVAPEVVEVRGVTATRAVPTGIDSGTGGYLPGSTPTAALLLLMLGGLALTGGAAASLVRRRG